MALELALEWAALGQRVLPVNGSTKRPLIKAWQEACTCDEATIREWWATYPQARVGMATGEPGYDVLDFDVTGGKPGLAQLERLIDAGVIEPGTFRVVATPSGGRHLWFAGTDQRNKQNDKSVPGVDFRGVGGMVLVPGNPGYGRVAGWSLQHSELKRVDWSAVVAALAPDLVVPTAHQSPASVPARPQSRLVAPNRTGYDNPVGEESPLDWFCRTNDLSDLLRADGWTFAYEHQGRWFWTRPGKAVADGVSANIWVNPDGRQTLVNYSTTVDLPTDQGMSAAQYWAYTRHRGDTRAAAGQIRRELMPRRYPAVSPATSGAVAGTSAPPAAPAAPVATKSAELVPAAEAGIPTPVADFWRQRTELREVWWQAQIGDVSPWAVLGNILACVAGRVGPHVVLPPKGGVGAPTSLNLLVAISGNTGEGKGTSGQVARSFMGGPYPPWRKPGTGQGIAAMFTEQTKDGPVQSGDTVILNVAEIQNLGAHMSQQGATITSTLLEVYMAEELGEHYANKELRRPVREGRYRLALIAGVQPDNAPIVFDHAASGLPQRFLWMPAHWDDAVLPETDLVPPAPGPELAPFRAWTAILPGTLDDSLDATGWSPSDAAGGLSSPAGGKKAKEPEAIPAPVKEPMLVTYSPAVAKEIGRDQRRKRNLIKARNQAGEETAGDPDSHLLLTRIKVATLMAVWLDQVTHISDEMWEMSRWVIWVSNHTRLKAQARIARKAADKASARVSARAAEKVQLDQHTDHQRTELVKHIADRVRTVLDKTPGAWQTTGAINRAIRSTDRAKLVDANLTLLGVLEDMEGLGELKKQETVRAGNPVTEWSK
jgi:hypothetical protein